MDHDVISCGKCVNKLIFNSTEKNIFMLPRSELIQTDQISTTKTTLRLRFLPIAFLHAIY